MMMDENISNLTSASGEISASTGSRIEAATLYSQQSFASTNQAPPPPKKKRSLPGNPDPDAEVIALSPKTLLARNRFICEICNKGFQRDQNLQLHRRGHNLPWKLKQRTNKEVIRKKVYVCPETTCVHHDPSRALGDLTGIKKHFCRKHGEKKWKCEKCSKRYAVQSDWKAHAKICGTREYRCDCGTLFSRRDSFITHRAFCDALAEESARAITLNPLISSYQQLPSSSSSVKIMKREQDNNIVPPWLVCPPPSIEDPTPPSPQIHLSSQLFPINNLDQQFIQHDRQSPSPNPNLTLPPFQLPTASPHMSATALLQKAAQMGVTISSCKPSSSVSALVRPHKAHMSETTNGFSSTSIATCTAGSRLGLSSREDMGGRVMTSFGNKAAAPSPIILEQMGTAAREGEGGGGGGPFASSPSPSPTLVHDMVTCLSSCSGFDEDFNGMFNPKKQEANSNNFFQPNHSKSTTESQYRVRSGNNDDGLTRDFLGLKAFSHKDLLNIAGLGHINSSSSSTYGQQQNQNQAPWQG